MGRCSQPLQLKLLTDQDTWDAYVGAGIFYFDSSPSLVWPFFAPICPLFIGFFLPLLAFPGHHGQARPLLSDCGSRPSQWFHQPILHIHHSLLFHRRWRQRQGAENDDIGSSDAARDVGYKRHFSKEQLEDWKTPLEIVKDNMWGACTFKCTICAVKVLALVHLPQTIYWQSEWVLKMGPGEWGEITRRDGSHHWTLDFEHNKMR